MYFLYCFPSNPIYYLSKGRTITTPMKGFDRRLSFLRLAAYKSRCAQRLYLRPYLELLIGGHSFSFLYVSKNTSGFRNLFTAIYFFWKSKSCFLTGHKDFARSHLLIGHYSQATATTILLSYSDTLLHDRQHYFVVLVVKHYIQVAFGVLWGLAVFVGGGRQIRLPSP